MADLRSLLPAARIWVDRVIDAAKGEPRIVGLTLGGSAVACGIDQFSDVDFVVICRTEDQTSLMAEARQVARRVGPLLASFTREHVGERTASDAVAFASVSREVEDLNRRVLRARDAMDRAYAEPLDVRAVAAVAHLSEAHFIRSFRAVFGETPHRYLQRRRVERSMFLLRETDRSVTDICFDVGFTSRGTFCRTFREIVGETPSDYRGAHWPMVAPHCFQMAATRPVGAAGAAMRSSSFGDASAATAP